MYAFLFKNRYGALAFVGLTMIGAAALVGTDEDDGLIPQTAASIEQQKADFDASAQELATNGRDRPLIMADPALADIPLAPDEALIDEAEGFDPTPVDLSDPLGIDANPETEDVVIVVKDGRPEI